MSVLELPDNVTYILPSFSQLSCNTVFEKDKRPSSPFLKAIICIASARYSFVSMKHIRYLRNEYNSCTNLYFSQERLTTYNNNTEGEIRMEN